MKTELKELIAKIPPFVKFKPIFFSTMVFNTVYGLVNVIISAAKLSLFIGMTGAYSLIFGIAKFYGLKNLKKTQEIKCKPEIIRIEEITAANISIYALVMSFLHFSLAIVFMFFIEENPADYNIWFIYFISAAAFIKIILAAVNTVRTGKNSDIIIHSLKSMDFANALISLALLQRAILYFIGYEHAKLVGGIGGVFFSLCAILVCLRIFFKFFKRGDTEDGAADRLN